MPVRPAPGRNIPHAEPVTRPKLTAADVMKLPHFIERCEAMDIEPTKRQARKYMARRNRWAPFSTYR